MSIRSGMLSINDDTPRDVYRKISRMPVGIDYDDIEAYFDALTIEISTRGAFRETTTRSGNRLTTVEFFDRAGNVYTLAWQKQVKPAEQLADMPS